MGMLLRYDQIETAFRLRLGNPTEGTFGRFYYDGIRDNLDEIRFMLNEAQRQVTWMAYNTNQTLVEDTVFLQVISGATRYTMSELFLGPVAVFHRQPYDTEDEVTRGNVLDLRAQTRYDRDGYRYRHYEIREKVPRIAARGIVQADSPDSIENDEQLRNVRVGDTCYNLTDNSEGVVEAVFPALDRIKVEILVNGETNRFQRGDIYQVDMREATAEAMEMWPVVNRADSKQAYSGIATNWLITKDAVIVNVTANISSIPSTFEDDERFLIQVSEHGETEVLGEGARVGLVKGGNKFEFAEFVQLREATRYDVHVIRADAPTEDVSVDSIQVTVKQDPESLEIRQARYPQPMEKDTDYCELPDYAHPAMYTYAAILAMMKVSRNPRMDPGLKADLKEQIDEIKNFQHARDERNVHYVAPMSGNRRSDWPYPGNYGYASVDIWDLI